MLVRQIAIDPLVQPFSRILNRQHGGKTLRRVGKHLANHRFDQRFTRGKVRIKPTVRQANALHQRCHANAFGAAFAHHHRRFIQNALPRARLMA